MNALSPSANIPSDVVDARICSVMLMDDSSGVGQLRSISWMSGSWKPCTHHLALALHPVSVSFQRRTKREEITRSRCFSLITYVCTETMMVTASKKVLLAILFDCFRKLHLLFDRKAVPRYLVGVPSNEIKFSMQRARLGRRNRKVSVFLAFSDVEAWFLFPCSLDVHRSFSFGRHPSSVTVTLHRHFVISPEGPSSVMLV